MIAARASVILTLDISFTGRASTIEERSETIEKRIETFVISLAMRSQPGSLTFTGGHPDEAPHPLEKAELHHYPPRLVTVHFRGRPPYSMNELLIPYPNLSQDWSEHALAQSHARPSPVPLAPPLSQRRTDVLLGETVTPGSENHRDIPR